MKHKVLKLGVFIVFLWAPLLLLAQPGVEPYFNPVPPPTSKIEVLLAIGVFVVINMAYSPKKEKE